MQAGSWLHALFFIACASLSLQAQETNSPALVSAIQGSGQTAAGDSFGSIISQNGQAIVFTSLAGDLVSLPTDPSTLNVYWKEWPDSPVQLVSMNAGATGGGNGSSGHPSISSNGQWVCFASRASDLAGNDTNQTTDVFLRDMAAGTTTLLSVNLAGTAAGQGQSSRPQITPDGRWVVFVSDAPDLVADDTNGIADVFVRDLTTQQTRLASSGGGVLPPLRNAELNGVSISADGTRVSFASRAVVYHPLVLQTNAGEIYVRDMALNQTWWASSNAASFLPHIPPLNVRCFDSILSPDGRSVVFKVQTNEFLSRNFQFTSLLLHHDLESGDTSLLATNAGTETIFTWSADSRWITFATDTDVYRWDRENGESQLVSVNSTGEQPGNGPSHTPILSADGNVIAFLSSATDLTTNDVPGTSQIYLRDLTKQTTRLLSANIAREAGDGHHTGTVPSLDGAGRLFAFDSDSGNLVPGDWNRGWDVFLGSSETAGLELISRALSGAEPPATGVSQKILPLREFSSRDGRYIALISGDDVFDVGDTNGYHDVYVRDLWEGATISVGKGNLAAFPEALLSGDPLVTAEGKDVYFSRRPFSQSTSSPPGSMEIWRYELKNGDSTFIRSVTFNHWGSYHIGRGQFHNLISSSEDGSELVYVDDDLVWLEEVSSGERTLVSSLQDGQEDYGNYSAPKVIPHQNKIFYLREEERVDVFVRDLSDAAPVLITVFSASNPNIEWLASTYEWDFSSDGRWLALHGNARTDLGPWGAFSTFVISRIDLEATNKQEIVCVECRSPSLSGDGHFIVYEQSPLDPDESAAVLLRDLRNNTTNIVSVNRFGTNAEFRCTSPLITKDGRYVVFSSIDGEIVEGDANGLSDIFVRDLALEQTFLVSQNRFGTGSGNGPSLNPVLAADGRTILFESFANDLVAGDYNAHRDIFMLRLGSEDSDEDDMDDDFEYAHFGSLERDGAGDHDGDGHTDLQEFQAGTSPTDDESILRVMTLSIVRSNSTRILWASVPGKTYRVQWRSGFEASATDWTDLPGDVVASAATASKTDDGTAGQGRRFYRVLVVP